MTPTVQYVLQLFHEEGGLFVGYEKVRTTPTLYGTEKRE